MFYTKYRPQKFSEISRPNEAADALTKQVLGEKSVHAYLFVGPRGAGKTSTARILAKALNCSDLDKNGDPCDKCSSCVSIMRGSYIDLIEIDAASNRGIDDIRELKNKVKLAPTAGNTKVYIIDEVHMLTNEAFNALLKTLEEPPKRTIFILCTTELHKVPETIKSRCQVYKFKRATVKQLVTKLDKIAQEEDIKIVKADLEKIARASMGGFRDAETMLQQIADGEVTIDSLLNISSREKYIEFCDLLNTRNSVEALRLINKIFDEGVDINVWLGEFVRHLRDLLLINSGSPADLLDIGDEILSEVKKQATSTPIGWLVSSIEILLDAQIKIKNSFIPQLPLEIAVVKICGVAPDSVTFETAVPDLGPAGVSPVIGKSVTSKIAVSPQKEVKPAKEKISQKITVNFDITFIEQKWSEVISKIEQINKSILGLLRVGKPVAIEGDIIVLEVGYLFHKERLEAPRNRSVVEQVLSEIYNADLKVKCRISDQKPKSLQEQEVGVLTDYNVVPTKEDVLSMLDGGLPL